jgi:homocitrate synthase NifV
MHLIEAGVPAMGPGERDTLRRMTGAGLSAGIVAWCRANRGDIAAAIASGTRQVHLSLPVSDTHLADKFGTDRVWACQTLRDRVSEALDQGLEVSVGFEDASRADDQFVIDLAGQMRQLGVGRIRWADTTGVAEPFSLRERLAPLVTAVPGAWEIHAHNDFGLATANTIAAVLAGFDWVSTTVAGLGERAGNAPVEEVSMALSYLHGVESELDTTMFRSLACLVARASRRPIPVGKAVIGRSAFTHESGIHVHGVLASPSTYEPFDPAEVGARRRIVVGKHAGRASIRHALHSQGLYPDDRVLERLLEPLRQKAITVKRPLRPREVRELYESAR